MLAEPPSFDRTGLVRSLQAGWGIEVGSLRYEPVGFGTHHYRVRATDGGDWFVNVDELPAKTWLGAGSAEVLDALDRALGTAAALREAGLEFVHAPSPLQQGSPLAATPGTFVARLPGEFAVSVFSVIDGSAHPHGEFPTDGERRQVLAALGRMHAASGKVPPDLPVVENPQVPDRAAFTAAVDELGRPWTGGPFAEPARRALRDRISRVHDLFHRYDMLVPIVRATRDRWVVTHGEPHAANVMRLRNGELRLIDWDTAALGPPERDLWMVEPRSDEDWQAYGDAARTDPLVMEFYSLRWDLSEICGYTAMFRAPHAEDANTRTAWRCWNDYLAPA